jgi:hypothetical protein
LTSGQSSRAKALLIAGAGGKLKEQLQKSAAKTQDD